MMKPHVPVLFAALVLGCKGSGPKDVPIDPDAKLLPVSKATVKQPIEAIRGLSTKMLTWVVRQGGTENTMVSPFSLAEVLTMLYPGATGKGKAELEALLGPNPDMSAIRKSLSPLEKGGILNQANAAWIKSGAEINPAYLEALKKLSGPQVRQSDFPEPALSEINDFANTQTHGRIPTILERLDPQAILVLANAIAYRDRWAVPFEGYKTHRGDFVVGDQKVSVPFMHADGEFAYLATPRLQAVKMDYKSGLGMTLWLPRKGVSLEVMFQEPQFGTLVAERREGYMSLPKWTGEANIDLTRLVPSIGVEAIFVRGGLEGIMHQAYVSQAVQKAWLRTDEEGTEAAVVTAAEVAAGAEPYKEEPFRFVADHPFAYTIHTPEGAILFCGVVRKP